MKIDDLADKRVLITGASTGIGAAALPTSDNLEQNLSNDGGYQVYGRSYLLDFGIRF